MEELHTRLCNISQGESPLYFSQELIYLVILWYCRIVSVTVNFTGNVYRIPYLFAYSLFLMISRYICEVNNYFSVLSYLFNIVGAHFGIMCKQVLENLLPLEKIWMLFYYLKINKNYRNYRNLIVHIRLQKPSNKIGNKIFYKYNVAEVGKHIYIY